MRGRIIKRALPFFLTVVLVLPAGRGWAQGAAVRLLQQQSGVERLAAVLSEINTSGLTTGYVVKQLQAYPAVWNEPSVQALIDAARAGTIVVPTAELREAHPQLIDVLETIRTLPEERLHRVEVALDAAAPLTQTERMIGGTHCTFPTAGPVAWLGVTVQAGATVQSAATAQMLASFGVPRPALEYLGTTRGSRVEVAHPTRRKQPIVTIDGLAEANKSPTAWRLACKLGYVHLNSGSFYRAIALAAERAGIPVTDTEALRELVGTLDIRLQPPPEPGEMLVFLNGEDVSEAIRASEISMAASDFAGTEVVRDVVQKRIRERAEKGGVVIDGRDAGTGIFPDAEVKFFFVGLPDARADRRLRALRELGEDHTHDEVREMLMARDLEDASREENALRVPPDAEIVFVDDLIPNQLANMLVPRIRMTEESLQSQGPNGPFTADHFRNQRLTRVTDEELRFGIDGLFDHHAEVQFWDPEALQFRLVQGLGPHGDYEVLLAANRKKAPLARGETDDGPCDLCEPPMPNERGLVWGTETGHTYKVWPNAFPYAPFDSRHIVVASAIHKGQKFTPTVLHDMMAFQLAAGADTPITMHYNGVAGNSQFHLHWQATREELPIQRLLDNGGITPEDIDRQGSNRVALIEDPPGASDGHGFAAILVEGSEDYVAQQAETIILGRGEEIPGLANDERTQGVYNLLLLHRSEAGARLVIVPRRAGGTRVAVDGVGEVGFGSWYTVGRFVLYDSDVPPGYIEHMIPALQSTLVRPSDLPWLRRAVRDGGS